MLYAYATGGAAGVPPACPLAASPAQQCSLGQALSLAGAGTVIALATPGSVAHYVGNWAIGTPDASAPTTTATTATEPLTIKPAPGVTAPILDGNHGGASGCPTAVCDGAVLSVDPGASLVLVGLSIEGGRNTSTGRGGVAVNSGTLTLIGVTFAHDSAEGSWGEGGAVFSQDECQLSAQGSTFAHNTASAGGGIFAVGNCAGEPSTLVVRSSAFSSNVATFGGAIADANAGPGRIGLPLLPQPR